MKKTHNKILWIILLILGIVGICLYAKKVEYFTSILSKKKTPIPICMNCSTQPCTICKNKHGKFSTKNNKCPKGCVAGCAGTSILDKTTNPWSCKPI